MTAAGLLIALQALTFASKMARTSAAGPSHSRKSSRYAVGMTHSGIRFRIRWNTVMRNAVRLVGSVRFEDTSFCINGMAAIPLACDRVTVGSLWKYSPRHLPMVQAICRFTGKHKNCAVEAMSNQQPFKRHLKESEEAIAASNMMKC